MLTKQVTKEMKRNKEKWNYRLTVETYGRNIRSITSVYSSFNYNGVELYLQSEGNVATTTILRRYEKISISKKTNRIGIPMNPGYSTLKIPWIMIFNCYHVSVKNKFKSFHSIEQMYLAWAYL